MQSSSAYTCTAYTEQEQDHHVPHVMEPPNGLLHSAEISDVAIRAISANRRCAAATSFIHHCDCDIVIAMAVGISVSTNKQVVTKGYIATCAEDFSARLYDA